jgi:NAD(P)H-dependent FMN reductase
MCEECMPSNKCTRNPDFNKLTDKLKTSDGIFFVIPHYAPVPSKLIILFEKIEEIFFLNTCQDKKFSFSLSDKPVGIIAHGGMIENYEKYYQENILVPMKNVLRAIRMDVIEIDDKPGVMFGAKDYNEQEKTITPGIEHDWEMIKQKVTPLVDEFMISCS